MHCTPDNTSQGIGKHRSQIINKDSTSIANRKGKNQPVHCSAEIFLSSGVSPGKTWVLANESAAYLVCLHFNVGIEEEPAIGKAARDGCLGKVPLISVASAN